MNIPKQGILVGLAVASVGVTGFVLADQANAQSGDDDKQTLISKIAKKFNVSESDVKSVFDADKIERDAARLAEQTKRLQALVDNKTITVEQKTKIEVKLAELKTEREANRDAFKDLTHEERKAKLDAQNAALETWTKDNGIDLTKLDGILQFGHGGPGHGDRGFEKAE